jgi:hypothetical protein
MAISVPHYLIVRDLFKQGLLPTGGTILELGEANWYGDIDPLTMAADARQYVTDRQRAESIIARVTDLNDRKPVDYKYDLAKIFYELFFSPSELQAIDFHGTKLAQKLDLNLPVTLSRRFDVIINHGTAEHIFNIAQVFRTMHDYALPGGLMLHESPFTGWIDHGFYTLQPTLFFDLAQYNQYAMFGMIIEDLTNFSMIQVRSRDHVYELAAAKQIPANSMLFTILRKGAEDQPFRIPIQGYYRGTLSQTGTTAWQDLR